MRYNATFRIAATNPDPAWRFLTPAQDPAHLCAFAYTRTVAADNTVQIDGLTLQIDAAPDRASFARCTVEVRQSLDGSWTVWWQDRCLVSHPAPATAPQLRVLNGKRVDPFAQRHEPVPVETTANEPEPSVTEPERRKEPWKPAKNHPWRQPAKRKGTFLQNS